MKIMTEHIPAHDCVTEIYKFDELDERIQERLVSRCAECHADDWADEYRDTLKELEKLFGVKCEDWSVGGWSHYHNLHTVYGDYGIDEAAECDANEFGYLALRGNRAMGKCWTLWEREVVRGNWHRVGKHSRYSRVVFGGLHDGSCPLTGFCADNDALDPLWDMMEGKHVKDGMTIAEMIDACFESFFTSWEKDIRYRQSEEYFRESEMAEWYDEDGNEVDVPKDAVLTDPTGKEVAA
jgi:hypothetical protein